MNEIDEIEAEIENRARTSATHRSIRRERDFVRARLLRALLAREIEMKGSEIEALAKQIFTMRLQWRYYQNRPRQPVEESARVFGVGGLRNEMIQGVIRRRMKSNMKD